jgi:hypothetical protein
MCIICSKILTKLINRGLVSVANVNEQWKEIKQETMKEYGCKTEGEMILLIETLIKARDPNHKPGMVN